MSLKFIDAIELPAHQKKGGFDHAAVDLSTNQLFIAHTSNDAVDVVDTVKNVYLRSLPDLAGVAGVLVDSEARLAFTSNRAEDTVGILSLDNEEGPIKIPVGVHPNGLAYDRRRNILMAANVGNPAVLSSITLSFVDVGLKKLVASAAMPGRTRWAVYDDGSDAYYVNIAEPAQIAVINPEKMDEIAHTIEIPAEGPHGLDIDREQQRLFCACDGKALLVLDLPEGKVVNRFNLSGAPDVVFFNKRLGHVYVAIGDPGVIDAFDAWGMRQIEAVETEKGAHTIAFDPDRNRVYAFLPETHRVAVYADQGK
jgi:DNA-binding beta-propeller fold protein YncE